MKTTRYEDFKIAIGNREINPSHVKQLKDSIAKNGYHGAPIVVSGDMTIIDGQHRFTACKELGIPVPYMIDKEASIETARYLNCSQKAWGANDFVKSFASTGNQNYVRLQQFMKTSGLPFRMAVIALRNDLSGAEAFAKAGEQIITEEHVQKGLELNAFWQRFRHLTVSTDMFNNMCRVLTFLSKSPEVDKKRLEKNLLKNGLKPFHNIDGAVREINAAYNCGGPASGKKDFTALYAAYKNSQRRSKEADK